MTQQASARLTTLLGTMLLGAMLIGGMALLAGALSG